MASHRTCTICGKHPQIDTSVRCENCQNVFNTLRVSDKTILTSDKRRAPDAARLRAAVLGGQYVAVPVAKKKSAGHTAKRDSLPMNEEVQEALGILRDARAARKGKQGYVYLIVEDIPGGGLHYGKIGFSTNPPARVAELQTGNPRKLRLHLSKPGTEADEAALHAKYQQYNCLQEWFWITKELLLEWDAAHQIKPAAQSGGSTTKEVTSA